MCQYSTSVTLAVCADVQRTGDPSACKRQTIVSAARAVALTATESSALDRHLDIICGTIDARRAEQSPVTTSTTTAATTTTTELLGAVKGSHESRKAGRKCPRAWVGVRSLARRAGARIATTLSIPTTSSAPSAAASPLRLLSQTTDSTTHLHRHFERSRIEKLGPSPTSSSASSAIARKEEERREEVEALVWTWLETGAFWVNARNPVPRRKGVRFADEVGVEGEGEWSSVLGHWFGIPGFGTVDSGVVVVGTP